MSVEPREEENAALEAKVRRSRRALWKQENRTAAPEYDDRFNKEAGEFTEGNAEDQEVELVCLECTLLRRKHEDDKAALKRQLMAEYGEENRELQKKCEQLVNRINKDKDAFDQYCQDKDAKITDLEKAVNNLTKEENIMTVNYVHLNKKYEAEVKKRDSLNKKYINAVRKNTTLEKQFIDVVAKNDRLMKLYIEERERAKNLVQYINALDAYYRNKNEDNVSEENAVLGSDRYDETPSSPGDLGEEIHGKEMGEPSPKKRRLD